MHLRVDIVKFNIKKKPVGHRPHCWSATLSVLHLKQF